MQTPTKRKSIITAAALVALWTAAGCGGQTDDGTHVALLPMRMLYQPGFERLYDDDATLVEHAVRLTYGIVQCRGARAQSTIDWLKTFANADTDNVSRYKSAVYVAKSGAPGVMENCVVSGSDTVSAGAFSAIFQRPARTQIEFEIQQFLWMAIRDTSDRTMVRYSAAFLQFLAENLAAEPVPSAATAARIDRMEALYNPCRAESATFDKTALYACAGGTNVVLTDEISKLAAPLVGTLAATNDAFIARLDAKRASAWRAAAKVRGTAKDVMRSNYVQFDDMKVSIDTPIGEVPALEDQKVAPEVAALASRKQGIMAAFGLVQQNQLSPAISVKNPRSLPLPPRLADGTLARPGEGDTSTMTAVKLSDGTYAVPNPSLHNNALVVPRWHHWSYLPGVGWKLVGHGGAPIYTSPDTSNMLAALTRAADVSGASALGAMLPGAGSLGVKSAELKRKPTHTVVNSQGMTGSTDPAMQKFLDLILNQILGKLGGSNSMTKPSGSTPTTPTTPTTHPTTGTTNMNMPLSSSSFGPTKSSKGFSNGVGNNLPDGTANSAHGTGVFPKNSANQPAGPTGSVTTVSKQNQPTPGSTAPLQPDPTIMANPFDGKTSMPFMTGNNYTDPTALLDQGPAATATNDFLTQELLSGNLATSDGTKTEVPPSTTGVGYSDGFDLTNPFDNPQDLTLQNTAPPSDPTWPGNSSDPTDLFDNGSGTGTGPGSNDPFDTGGTSVADSSGVDQPSYSAPDDEGTVPTDTSGLWSDNGDYSDPGFMDSGSFDTGGDVSGDEWG